MKEQILHLEAHDDFTSARDKMGWAQTSRVLLVWPAEGRVLARRLDLVLLQRHASRLGAQLALITTDPVVVEHARELGLTVFGSLEASRRRRWRRWGSRTARHRPARASTAPDPAAIRAAERRAAAWRQRLQLPRWAAALLRGAAFGLGLAALASLALALVPGATVTLAPAMRPITATLEVVAAPETETAEGSAIPARAVRVEVEASGSTATTGLREVPTVPATGSVIFTNIDGIATTVPAGTGVRTTSGTAVRFRTNRSVTLEGRIGATAGVDVTAVEPGPAGNVAAGQINAIEGPLGLRLAVTNPAGTSGGAATEQPSVTEGDRARLRAELLAQLQSEALGAIESQLRPGEFLAADSLVIDETVAQTYEQAVGEPADSLQLTLRMAFAGLAVSEADALKVAQAALAAQVGPGEVMVPGQERYERDPATRTDEARQVHFNVTARSAVVPVVDREAVRAAVRGQRLDESRFRLQTLLALAGPPDIRLTPGWLGRLPVMPFRINVVVLNQEA